MMKLVNPIVLFGLVFSMRIVHYLYFNADAMDYFSSWICSANRKSANLRSGSETLLFSLQICGLGHEGNLRIAICGLIIKIIFGFAICGPSHLRNLRICDCGMSPRICGFAICGIRKKICVPTFEY